MEVFRIAQCQYIRILAGRVRAYLGGDGIAKAGRWYIPVAVARWSHWKLWVISRKKTCQLIFALLLFIYLTVSAK